jgi:deazaflavin-dependent oxidoreductase (nitroreductase family)
MTDITGAVSARITNFIARRRPMMARDATAKHVAKYVSSNGRKGNSLFGHPVFLLDVVGRSTGTHRPVMLMYAPRGDDLIVVGSAAGTDKTPNWYLNLMAAGGGEVQVGAKRWTVSAREVSGAERDECWALAVKAYGGFDAYSHFTERRIPVAILEPRPTV